MDPGSGGGLLRTLGEDDGDGGLIGLPVRRAGTSGPPAGGAGGATAKGGANGKTPRGGSNSHVSISSDDDDEEEGKGSRYASLGKLGARPGHRGSGTSSPKPAGKTTASKDLNDYPSYPRGRVTATTASDGSSSEGASVPAKFAFKMLENQTKKKSRATAAKTMQAILIDSDDDEPAKSPKKTNEGSKLAAERAETPATKGTASNASAKKAGRALDTPSSARKHGKSPKSNDDFIPLGGSSDSDSGSMEAPEKVAPSKKKKTSYANSDSVAAAKPNPTSQKDSSLRDSGSPTRLLPLAGDFIPPTAPIPQKILVIPSLNPSLPEPVPPEPIRPVESASAASSVLSTSDANSIGRPKSAAERRKERRKRAKQRKLLADKDEEGEESDGAATPATSNAAEQSQQGSEEEDAIPGLGSMDKGKGPAQWLDSKPIAAVSGKNVAVIPPSEPKSRFSFTIGAQKTALSSVDLNKPLFRAAAEPPKPPSSTATEEEEADMEIESNAPSPGTSVSKDAYVDQDSMRARKKARTSAVEEDFISFADLLSDEEPEPKEPKRERYRPPPTARSGPEDERKRMFGDPSIFNPPLLNLPEPPWIPDGKQYLKNGGHPAAMLNAEVKDFIEYIQPRPNEHAMRQIVVERVTTAVRSVWPNATVEVFGSFDTKMYLPSSDIDLVVFEPTARPPMCLEPLARAMKDLGLVHSLEIISTARVPIIKSVDSLTLFRLDISFNMNSGLESAKIVKEMLESRVGGALRAMMFVLKQFLLQRNMNEVFSGGVGSYGLMIMIANFLMLHPLIQSGIIEPMDSLGTLIMDFFELYGKNLSQQTVGIGLDLENGGYYFPKRGQGGGRGGLTVIDPQDSSNDVTRGSFAYPSVRREFSNAHDLLRVTIQSYFADAKKYERDQLRRDEAELGRRGRHTRYDSSDDDRRRKRPRSRSVSPRGKRRKPRAAPAPPSPPTTLLGLIVRVRKSVQEHRTFVSTRWDEIQSGKIDPRQGKGVWGQVDQEWLAEIVEGEGREKKEVATPVVAGTKRKAPADEEDEEEVIYVAADSDEEPPKPSPAVGGKLKQPQQQTQTPKSPARDPVLADLLGDAYDVLSGEYQMVGKVPVIFDDRRASGVGRADLGGLPPVPKIRGLKEDGDDDEEEEEEKSVVMARRPGDAWD